MTRTHPISRSGLVGGDPWIELLCARAKGVGDLKHAVTLNPIAGDRDEVRLRRLFDKQPIVLLFSGKAHPDDRMGKSIVARLTSMEQPLGLMVGNALEVQESLDVLEGKGPPDIVALTVELGAEMLVLGKVAKDLADGRARIERVLKDGSARETFGKIIEAQGGDRRVLDNRALLPSAPRTVEVQPSRPGIVQRIDTEAIGVASMMLGGGRKKATDVVDPRVGIRMNAEIGTRLGPGDSVATLHVGEIGIDEAKALVQRAFSMGDAPAAPPALFVERIAGAGA